MCVSLYGNAKPDSRPVRRAELMVSWALVHAKQLAKKPTPEGEEMDKIIQNCRSLARMSNPPYNHSKNRFITT